MDSKTILFAEDEELLRRMIARSLREGGFRVVEAQGGMEALKAAAAQPSPIDLLLADILMPDMDGRELARRLISRRPEMKVLFISGYYKEAELESGSNFLGKPFTPGELLSRVRQLLD